MTIEPFAVDLADPLSTASGRIDRRQGFLVRCSYREQTGIGEATPLRGWTESVEDCERALRSAEERASEAGVQAARRALPTDAPAARHGVTTALMDADARVDGVPLCTWFDGERTPEPVPVNATIGDGPPEDAARKASAAVGSGFDCLKVKVGAGSPSRDVERLRAVRGAVDDGPTLRVDANGAWSRERASELLDEFASLGVSYLEQPLDPDDLAGHAALRGGSVEIALDESLVAVGVADVLDAEAADVLVLNPMVLGGPGETYAIATRCREVGIEPVVSTTIDAVVARTAAAQVAAAIPDVRPCGLATADRLATDLGPDPAPITDGKMHVPDGPGVGVTEVSVDG